jgi:hypothetical protein
MQVSTIGLDLAKIVFQVHGIDANENGARSRSAYLFVLWLQMLREGIDAPERPGPEPCILKILRRGAPCQDLPSWFSRC